VSIRKDRSRSCLPGWHRQEKAIEKGAPEGVGGRGESVRVQDIGDT
jgi:hypothetical protein